MEKIVVIGSSGAGKSTFAQKLSAILGIEVVHLDRYFWQPDWKEYPRTERLEIQQKLLQEKSCWIIEGTYLGSSDDRLNAADTIIFLDIPWFFCLWRVIVRHTVASSMPVRLDIPEGCADRMTFYSLLKVLAFPVRGRRLLLRKMKVFRAQNVAMPGKRVLHYRSSKSAEHFLLQVQAQHQKTLLSLVPELAPEARNQQDIAADSLGAVRGDGDGYSLMLPLLLGPDNLLVLSKPCNCL